MQLKATVAMLGSIFFGLGAACPAFCAPAAAQGAASPVLAEQAAAAKELTMTRARVLHPQWTTAQAEEYGRAVEQGVLRGASAPLDEAALADLHAGIEYLITVQPESLEPPAFAKACADYASWLVETMVSRTPRTEGDRAVVRRQIDELAQVVGRAVTALGATLAAEAQKMGVTFRPPESLSADAAERFRERAVAAERLSICPLFKSPLDSEHMSSIRRNMEERSRLLSRQHDPIFDSWDWLLLGVGPKDSLPAAHAYEAASVVDLALWMLWAYSVHIPADLDKSLDEGLNARRDWANGP